MQWKHDDNLKRLKKDYDAPGMGTLDKVFMMNHTKKLQCLHSQNCQGWNTGVFDGHFERCSGLHPFWAWNEVVDEKKYEKSLDSFMDQYEIGTF